MSTGDQQNVAWRLSQLLPPSWFPDPATNKWGFLQGFAAVAAWCYGLISFAKLQTRISTATGFFLDLMAYDFFGRNYGRGIGMSDALFAIGIKHELLRVRATRAGLTQALIDLTGRAPLIFEPTRPLDTGGYGYACGYSVAGAYGSMLMPYQALVTAFRPATSGIPAVPGYGVTSTAVGFNLGGYSLSGEYADLSQIVGPVTDAQIYARIDSVKSIATIPWTHLSN